VAQEVTRRGVLALTALGLPLLASACKGIAVLGTPPSQLPDVAAAREAIAGEQLLIARYRAVLAAMPALAGQLRPVLAQHTQHLARLRGRLRDPATARPAPSSPGPAPATPPVPPSPTAAIAALRAAEDAAATALLRHLGVVSPSFAQLLASIAASEASHALLLRPAGHAR
jgi:hypothetical protein